MKTQHKEKTSLIFHGHFYQPPRENPHTGIIGKQLSALPYSDWNERIQADCYNANTHSRYLSGVRRILSMTNNYEYLSFNFGPTLLSWMQKNHPYTYELILDADARSEQRLGYGNAIAQAYNHSILPLCTKEDAKTQILWGLDDFSHRFKREALGLWLPETAINKNVVDLLAQSGVRYVILSPWQCRSIKESGKPIASLGGKPAPYGRPFLLRGTSGSTIYAFFYNHQLAEGISFGHFLRDADLLYHRLLSIKREERQSLIHTATDGEIYGHHEPYGDMALAALIKKVEARDDFTITNYAAYLSSHPAQDEAFLHLGEEEKGTSWSCSHGVSRWYKNCGCHTGGDDSWNQNWRTPLRKGFDTLREELDAIYVREVQRLFNDQQDPWKLLNSFAPVASALTDMKSFLAPFSLSNNEEQTLANLLIGQQYKHFCYTSCGWFFNDIAGIEPRQNITYALMALQLYQRYTEKDLLALLLKDLAQAKANRKQDGNGKDIALQELKALPGEVEAALFYILNRKVAQENDYSNEYGYFFLDQYTEQDSHTQVMKITNKLTLSTYLCTATDPNPEKSILEYTITALDLKNQTQQSFFLEQDMIPLRMRDLLFEQIERNFCILDEAQIKCLSNNLFHYDSLAKNIPYLPMGSLYQQLIGSSLSAIKSLFMYGTLAMWNRYKDDFSMTLDFIAKFGKQPDIQMVASIFNHEMSILAQKFQTYGLHNKSIRFVLEFLIIVRNHNFQPDLTALQDVVYPYLCMQKTPHKNTDITLINALGEALNFDIAIH